MSSDCGLHIEKMSVQQIRTIIEDLSDENKSLKYQLNLMKKCFEAFVKFFDKMNDSLSEEEFKQLSSLKNQLENICQKQTVDKQNQRNIWPQISQLSAKTSEESTSKSCGFTEQLSKQLSDSQNQVVVELSDDSDQEVDKTSKTEDKASRPSTSDSIDSRAEHLNQIKDFSEELIVSHNLDSNDSIELIDISSEPINKPKQISSGQTSFKNNEIHLKSDKRKEQMISKNEKRKRVDQLTQISNVYVNNIEAEVSFSVEESPSKRIVPKKTYTVMKDNSVGKGLKNGEIQTSCTKTKPIERPIGSNFQQLNSLFKCIENSCEETFINEISLINHSKGIHNKIVKKCVYKECRYFYNDRSDYWPHLKTVHKDQEPPFKCELNSCNKSFWTNADLNRHITQFHAINRHFKSDNNFQFNSTTLLLNTNPFNRIKYSALVHPNGMLRQSPKKQPK